MGVLSQNWMLLGYTQNCMLAQASKRVKSGHETMCADQNVHIANNKILGGGWCGPLTNHYAQKSTQYSQEDQRPTVWNCGPWSLWEWPPCPISHEPGYEASLPQAPEAHLPFMYMVWAHNTYHQMNPRATVMLKDLFVQSFSSLHLQTECLELWTQWHHLSLCQ